jgi:hypothetical protein
MGATVVYRDGQTNEVRQDGRTTRPGLDRTLVIGCTRRVDLLQKVQINERAFFCERAIVNYPLVE